MKIDWEPKDVIVGVFVTGGVIALIIILLRCFLGG